MAVPLCVLFGGGLGAASVLLVVGVNGTGKTTTLTARVAWLVAAALEPVERAGFGFVEGDCAVTDIHQIAEPVGFYDRENSAFVRAVSFTVRYGLVPVGAA